MTRKSKKKFRPKKMIKSEKISVSTDEILSKAEVDSENVVRLKVTVRKGARIESIPLKKLERLAKKTELYWKLEDDWLMLYGFSKSKS